MPESPQKTLYLIDGHAQIFRAYFAIRGGMNSPVTGEPTAATFGFTGMLLKLYAQFRPQYVAVAHDMPGKTFRDDLYDQYKATRAAPPEDLAPQVQRIFEITGLFGVPLIGQEGAEADDVIATIVRTITSDPKYADVHVRIVSKDKDLEQLLSPRVTMFDIHTDTEITVASLLQNKGIRPDQVVDVLTLAGDTVDNIPGVPGIGPKTAAALIQEFGSVENLLENLDKVKGKKRENIAAAREHLVLGKQLFKLKDDLDLDFTLDRAQVGAIDATALRRMFNQLGFRRHLDDLNRLLSEPEVATTESEAAPAPAPSRKPLVDSDGFATSLFDAGPSTATEESPARDPQLTTAEQFDYKALTTEAQVRELADTLRRQPIFALDTETIGLGHHTQLCGLSFAWTEGSAVYVPTCSPDPASHLNTEQAIAILKPVLEDPAVRKTGHNIKYDMHALRKAGVRLRGVVFDTMIAAFLTNQPGNGLKDLGLSLLKHESIRIEQLIGRRERGQRQKRMDQVDLALITPYAAEDADVSLRLYHKLRPMIDDFGMTRLADEVEFPLIEVLHDMEAAGIRVDAAVLAAQQQELGQRIVELRQSILDAAGCDFNPDSPKQLADVLFKRLGLPTMKRTKTGPSTDSEVLERLTSAPGVDPAKAKVPRLILEYRQLTKLVNTYLETLRACIDKDTCRVHATFHQTGAATGRLSSSDPNLQNIPIRTEIGRQIRKAFIAEPGHLLISADYSQIELRILAHFSQDEALLDAFAHDRDIHQAVAAQVFNVPLEEVTRDQRSFAKTINFGIIYGMGPAGLQRRIEGLDFEAAKKLIADYKNRFKGINRFLDECVAQAETHGYVTTILGRRREIPEIRMRNPQQQSLGQRLAINTVVQGSAADLIKLAMVNLHRRIKSESLPMKLLLQIHDELVLETPEAEASRMMEVVKHEMQTAMQLRVPLKVDASSGRDWFEAK